MRERGQGGPAGPCSSLLSTPTPPALLPPALSRDGAHSFPRQRLGVLTARIFLQLQCLHLHGRFERKGESLSSSSFPSLNSLPPQPPGFKVQCPQRSPELGALPWLCLSRRTNAQGSTRNILEASGSGRATDPPPASRDSGQWGTEGTSLHHEGTSQVIEVTLSLKAAPWGRPRRRLTPSPRQHRQREVALSFLC